MDARIREHARILVEWSTEVKRGDMVIIRATPNSHDLAVAIRREVSKRGGQSIVLMASEELALAFYDSADDETLATSPDHYVKLMESSDVYIGIHAPQNTRALANIDSHKSKIRRKAMESYSDAFMKTRWCSTTHPTFALAQEAGMSLEEYQDFVYSATLVDWVEEGKAMYLLKEHLERHSDIRYIGPKTNLYARTEGRIWVASDGKNNMPSGEVYTSPVEDSVEGMIFFDVPVMFEGKIVKGVNLAFENGMVVDYSASQGEDTLKDILNVDEGASRLGEIAIGTNRGIKQYTMNAAFDEKIGDTVHCALGDSYEKCNGTNKSGVHVDIVKSMQEGEILAGEELIYSKGKYFYEM